MLHTCFYTVPVTDAATAPASFSQPSTTTQTAEKILSHVAGMYITVLMRHGSISALCTVYNVYSCVLVVLFGASPETLYALKYSVYSSILMTNNF